MNLRDDTLTAYQAQESLIGLVQRDAPGWKGMKNGDVLEQAVSSFDLFITRDKVFDSAQLGHWVGLTFGIVLLAIPQQPGAAHAAAFERSWPDQPQNLIGKVTRIGLNP